MNYVRSRDAQKQLARTSLRSIKWLKFIKTAIKVYIRHEKLCFCCFLTVSCHINAILASCNVLVFQLLSNDPGKVPWIAISFVMRQRCFPYIGMFSFLHRECINLHEGHLRNKMHLSPL